MKLYLSYLRVVSAFAVVLLHTSGAYVVNFEKHSFGVWNAANILDSCTRFCVPVFLMVTGTLLLNKDEELFTFLKKRYKRILLPFIFWVLVYICFNFTSPLVSVANLKSIFISFLKPVVFHLWYIYLILGLYLFIPILRKWTVTKNIKETHFFLGAWCFTLLINNKTRHFLPEIDLSYFTGSIGFLVLGHYLSNITDFKNRKIWKWSGLAIFIISTLIIWYLTQIYTIKYSRFFSYFYEGIFSAIQALGVFLFFMNSSLKKNKFVDEIDTCSYGIYLIHILILSKIVAATDFYKPISGGQHFLYLLMLSATTFIVSFSIIYILRKIPYLKNFVS